MFCTLTEEILLPLPWPYLFNSKIEGISLNLITSKHFTKSDAFYAVQKETGKHWLVYGYNGKIALTKLYCHINAYLYEWARGLGAVCIRWVTGALTHTAFGQGPGSSDTVLYSYLIPYFGFVWASYYLVNIKIKITIKFNR